MKITEEYRTRPRKGRPDLEARRVYVSGGGVWIMSRRENGWGVYRSGVWHRAGETLSEARERVLSFAKAPVGVSPRQSEKTREEPISGLSSFDGEEWL